MNVTHCPEEARACLDYIALNKRSVCFLEKKDTQLLTRLLFEVCLSPFQGLEKKHLTIK